MRRRKRKKMMEIYPRDLLKLIFVLTYLNFVPFSMYFYLKIQRKFIFRLYFLFLHFEKILTNELMFDIKVSFFILFSKFILSTKNFNVTSMIYGGTMMVMTRRTRTERRRRKRRR